MRLAALYAQQSRGASLVTSPRPSNRVLSISSWFQPMDIRFNVLVMMGGGIHQRLIQPRHDQQEDLSQAANRLHNSVRMRVEGLASARPQLTVFEQGIADMVIEE